MNLFERIVKYMAVAFAVMLSFGIITGILTGVLAAVGMLSEDVPFIRTGTTERVDFVKEFSGVKSLKIDVSSERVEIREGDAFRVTATHVPKHCLVEMQHQTLVVESESEAWITVLFWDKEHQAESHILIEVPTGFMADTVQLDHGAGAFSVEKLDTKKLMIETGSGSFIAKHVSAKETELDTHSGNVTIEDSALGELQLDTGSGLVRLSRITAQDIELESGSGSLSIEGTLTGNCSLETGSGRVDVLLYGDRSDYRIVSEIGSGGFWVEGNRVKEDHIDISAKHTLEFDTGSGRVSVEFQKHEKDRHHDTSC